MSTTKKKRPGVTLISERTWQGHQSWNREVIENIGGKRLRFTIKVDAYDFQSWGKAELWNGERWNEIHHIPGQKLRCMRMVSYVSRTCDPALFEGDIKELRSVAKGVLF